MQSRPRLNETAPGACSRQFTAIALHSFFMASGAHLIGMGIPIFVLRNWSSDFFSGVAISIPSFFYIITTLLFGKISAKIGRKKSMLVSLAGNLAIFAAYFSLLMIAPVSGTSWMLPVVLLCRGGEGFAQGLFWPTLEARISDLASFNHVNDEEHGKLTGKGVSFFNLGWNVGLLFASFTFWLIMAANKLEIVIFLSIIFQAMNVFIYKFSSDVDSPRGRTEQQPLAEEHGIDDTHPANTTNKHSWSVPATLGILLVFFYGFSLQWIFATTTNFSYAIGIVPLIGIFEALRLAMQTITSTWFKHGARLKIGTIIATAAAVVALTIAIGFSASGNAYGFMFLWFPLLGLVMGTMYAESLNMVELSGVPENNGHVMGFFESAGAVGNFSGPLIAGCITQAVIFRPYMTSFFIGAIIFTFLIIFIAAIVVVKYKKK